MSARPNPLDTPGKEFTVNRLLDFGLVAVRSVDCRGTCRHRSAEECASHTHFVFPYRGVYLRHVGGDQAVADANHVLFFNEGQGYQVSHAVIGGDASLVLSVAEATLRELAPRNLVCAGGALAKKTCAACDYPLDPKSTIEVKIGGKTVGVCCEECATKLR